MERVLSLFSEGSHNHNLHHYRWTLTCRTPILTASAMLSQFCPFLPPFKCLLPLHQAKGAQLLQGFTESPDVCMLDNGCPSLYRHGRLTALLWSTGYRGLFVTCLSHETGMP